MPKLRRGIDPLQVDLLQRFTARMGEHGFAEGHDALLDAWDGALEQDEVVLDFAVADKATHATLKGLDLVHVREHKEAQVKKKKTYGVIFFLDTSNSVEALPASEPLPIR